MRVKGGPEEILYMRCEFLMHAPMEISTLGGSRLDPSDTFDLVPGRRRTHVNPDGNRRSDTGPSLPVGCKR